MFKLLQLSWFLGLVVTALQAYAEDRFQIELVVFSQDLPTTELFDQTETEIQWPDKVLDATLLSNVAASEQALKPVYDKLTTEPSYRVLMHAAWQQSIPANATGEAVHIHDVSEEVSGFIRIQRGEYLNLTLDLEYQPFPNQFYRLNEARRIKFNEQHYFDHPKFGVIAIVKPL